MEPTAKKHWEARKAATTFDEAMESLNDEDLKSIVALKFKYSSQEIQMDWIKRHRPDLLK